MSDVNFVELLAELKEKGISNMKVQDLVGCSYPTINAIANGFNIDPRYSVACKIIHTHEFYVKGEG